MIQVGGIEQSKAGQNEQADKTSVNQELQNMQDMKQMDKQTQTKGHDDKLYEQKLLEHVQTHKQGDKKGDIGTRILSNLVRDLGMDMTPKTASKGTSGKINDEIEKMLEEKSGKEDKTELSKTATRDAVRRAQARGEGETGEKEKQRLEQMVAKQDVKQACQDFSSAYASYSLTSSPSAKEKLEDAQDRLKKKGFADSDIKGLEKTVKRSFRSQVTAEVQNDFVKFMMSPKNTFDMVVKQRQYQTSYGEAVQAGAIAPDAEGAKMDMDNIKEASLTEMKDFIRDAVESNLMEKHLSDRDNKDELKQLLQLGNKVGFNFEQFIKTWEQKKVDLGLFVIEVQQAAGVQEGAALTIGEVKSGGVGDKHGYEMDKDEEKELLVNQLRAEYMNKALSNNAFSNFRLTPKINKLKNGLIKLGLVSDVFVNIEKEAKALARYKTLEMLREAFIERSTYFELTGTSYGVLNNKIKGLISNLDHLDMKLDKDQLDMIRDDANRQMHDHTIIELKSAIAMLESHPNPDLEKRVPQMVQLIERLRTESGFTHGLGEDIDRILDKYGSGKTAVKESA